MATNATGRGGQDKTVGVLSAAVWILATILVAVVMELSYWWATQEKIIADKKIDKLKRELEICRREKENE